jgi:mannose-6-phosphate isomerase-like protein (cupin superfamily)
MISNNLRGRNRKKAPNLRTVKKHSDIVKNRSQKLMVGGQREKTDTGYKVPGYKGKSFETYYEYMMAGSSTPFLKHEKKDRTIRVLSGTAFVVFYVEGGQSQKRLIPGDEISLERGNTYRIATSNEDVELLGCQQVNYENKLEIVEDVRVTVDTPAYMLEEPTREERVYNTHPEESISKRRGSKAREQMQNQQNKKGEPVATGKNLNALSPDVPNMEGGMNPQPSKGAFTEEGAG